MRKKRSKIVKDVPMTGWWIVQGLGIALVKAASPSDALKIAIESGKVSRTVCPHVSYIGPKIPEPGEIKIVKRK